MAANQRVRWLAAALAVAIVAAIVVRSGGEAPPAAAARQRPTPAATRAAQTQDNSPPADVNLEALAAARGTPSDGGRDPFRFQRAEPPLPEPKRLPGIPDDQVGAPPPPRAPTGPPPPPPITLKFIGLVQKADGTKLAVLSDGKGPPISGTEGQEIEGRYKILKIGTESLEISYIDGRGRQTIRLTGQ